MESVGTMTTLACIPPDRSGQCITPAVWWVWFKGVPLYTYACDAHLVEYIARWKNTDHPVVQATRIDGGEVVHYD